VPREIGLCRSKQSVELSNVSGKISAIPDNFDKTLELRLTHYPRDVFQKVVPSIDRILLRLG
jgi:hypothetical protein